jgi:outer membrane immunogenic protein
MTRNVARRRTAILGAVCAAGFAASAHAADLTPIAATESYKDQIPVTSWTGFYLGLNGGYGWSAGNSTLYAEAALNGSPAVDSPISSFEKSGGFGGGQIGYNLQRSNFVFGIETDIQGGEVGGHASASATSAVNQFTYITATTYRESHLDWFGTVRGRAGYTVDRALIYFTGGFAYGGMSGVASATLDQVGGGAHGGRPIETVNQYSVNTSAFRTGYVLGGGVEYALTPAWSLKGEYQFIDFGSASGFVGYHDLFYHGASGRGNYTIDQNYNTVRVGLNYKLEAPDEALK